MGNSAGKTGTVAGRRDDPDIRNELNMDPEVFDQEFGLVVKPCYQIRERSISNHMMNDFDNLLGLKWNERILNEWRLCKYDQCPGRTQLLNINTFRSQIN